MPIPGYNEPFLWALNRIADKDGKASGVFSRWFDTAFQARVNATPAVADPPEVLDGETASTSGTVGGTQSAGLYRVSYYAQILTPAGVASGLQLTLTWTHEGVAQTETFTNLTGNLVTTHQSQTYMIEIDPGTTIGYTLTYTSNPAAAMAYYAVLCAELIQPLN